MGGGLIWLYGVIGDVVNRANEPFYKLSAYAPASGP